MNDMSVIVKMSDETCREIAEGFRDDKKSGRRAWLGRNGLAETLIISCIIKECSQGPRRMIDGFSSINEIDDFFRDFLERNKIK